MSPSHSLLESRAMEHIHIKPTHTEEPLSGYDDAVESKRIIWIVTGCVIALVAVIVTVMILKRRNGASA